MFKINKEEFEKIYKAANAPSYVDKDFVFKAISLVIETINEVNEHLNAYDEINYEAILNYTLGEYTYYYSNSPMEKRQNFNNENYLVSMASVVADKYLSSDLFGQKRVKYNSRFSPAISTLDVYLNFMGNMLENFKGNEPNKTLIRDLFVKSVSISRAILEMMIRGYDTEAMMMYRTVHECECTLIILDKYPNAIDSYVKHMKYAIAYRGGYETNVTDDIFTEIKEEMKQHDLKSKDMKKFIEYGWMYSVPIFKEEDGYKLNFRNGIEVLAGLTDYEKIYEQSSEVVHATPSLIYSNKYFYHHLVLLTLYETFFRIEKIFFSRFISCLGEFEQKTYGKLRDSYLPQAISIHSIETINFKKK